MEDGRKGLGRKFGRNLGRNLTGVTGASRGITLLVVLLALGLVLAWNSYSYRQAETISPEMAAASLKGPIYLVVLALEAEFEDTGAYPPDLESIDVAEDEVTYFPTGDGYRLVATDGNLSFEFRSGDDLEPYRSAFEFLLPPSGAK